MDDTKPFKRKRKANFRRRTLKFSKRGKFGHGSHIDQDMFDYFCRVVDVQKKGFDSDEEKVMFANNVLEQALRNEVEYASNQVASWALEAVIPLADMEHLKQLEESFSQELRIVFADRFASHVTQKLVEASALRVKEGAEEVDGSFCIKCCKFAVNNLEEFALNQYASHVVRSCLDCLTVLQNETSHQLAKLFYGALIESPILTDLVQDEMGSCLVQRAVLCLHGCRPKLCQKAITRITDSVLSPSDQPVSSDEDEDKKDKTDTTAPLPAVFSSMASVRLLECAIQHSTGKRFTQLYAKLFINRMVPLSLNRQANLAVQKLIRAATEPTEFEGMFDELSGSFSEIISCRHFGVIESLASTCQSLGVRQGEFINHLMKALKCFESEEKQLQLVSECIRLGGKADGEGKGDLEARLEVGLQGSLIIQSMLCFKKPIKVINSILAMDPSKLVILFNNPRGSHICDAFFKGEFVGEKSKDKLFKKLQGKLVELVVGKHGSRCVELLWERVSSQGRDALIAELSRGEATVTASQYGTIVASKLGLAAYRHDRQGWAKALSARQASTHLFKDIIGDTLPSKKSKEK